MNAPQLGIRSLAGRFVSDAGDDNGLESNRTRCGTGEREEDEGIAWKRDAAVTEGVGGGGD